MVGFLFLFLGETLCVSRYWDRLRPIFVRHEISSSNISKTVWPTTTKFYSDIHNDIVYSHTGHDVIIYFLSEVIGDKQSKMPPATASGGISRERFKLGSSSFTCLSTTSGIINLPEMASPSPAPSGRLQNAIIFYRNVRKTGPNCRKRLMSRKWCAIWQRIM